MIPVRNAARALLIHDDKLLLMRVVLYNRTFWCTIGGGMEEGETVEEAIRRETREETGLTEPDIRWIRPVWRGEHVHGWSGVRKLHRETYVLGYISKANIDPAGFTDEEKTHVKEFRWWSVPEMETTDEFIVPPRLIEYLKPIMRGEVPSLPIEIDLTDRPVNKNSPT